MEKLKTDNLIIGGGLTGLSAAQSIKKNTNEDFLIIDKSNTVGGLTRSVHIDDYTFDYTGHFLHLKEFKHPKEIIEFIDSSNWELVYKKSCCYYNGKLVNAPFQYNLFDLGEEKAKTFYDSYKNRIKSLSENPSLDEYFRSEFGDEIANAFLIPYNEKLLGINLKTLGTKGLNRFFPHPNEELIHSGAFSRKTEDQSYNSRFWYPKRNGIEELVKALASGIKHIKSKVIEIDLDNKIAFTEDGTVHFEKIISSIPLPELMKISNSANINTSKILSTYENLHSAATLGINIGFRGELHEDVKNLHWLYFSERKYVFHRIGFYSNFNESLAPKGNSSIYVEVGIDNNRINNIVINKIVEEVINQLQKLEYFNIQSIEVMHTTLMRNSYVRFDEKWESTVESARRELLKYNILSTGRYGRWDYTSMEDSILDGAQQRF